MMHASTGVSPIAPLAMPFAGAALLPTPPRLPHVLGANAQAKLPLPVKREERRELTPQQQQMVVDHLPMVRYIARGMMERLPPQVELEELVSAGTFGLVDAARRYTPSRNVQFRSFAQFRIRGAILDSLRSLDWSPRDLRRKGRELQQARCVLEGRLGRVASEAELAEAMGLTLADLHKLVGALHGLGVEELNVELGEDAGGERLDQIAADDRDNPLTLVLEGEQREQLALALERLPERQREILRLYYFEERTMREIGQTLGVVESRISQLHHEALRKLRSALQNTRRPQPLRAGTAAMPRHAA